MITKLACDFETVVTGEKDQRRTEVWSCAGVDLSAENNYESVFVGHSIEEFFDWLYSHTGRKTVAYFHNEKFDGSFILDYLMKHGYKVATMENDGETSMISEQKDMKNNEFTCLISTKGIWYAIKIKHGSRMYEIRDSYKLLPFSLKKIGKDFDTQHKKLEMEYIGNRYAGCPMTQEEIDYQKNDVLVLKEALNIMEEEGHSKLTIGSCCMSEYKKYYDQFAFKGMFPNLYTDNYELNLLQFGSHNAGEYIRRSYKGGWCYLKPEKANKTIKAKKTFNGKKIAGTTCDVNSLYPSMMHSDSGNRYPIGEPHFFKGDLPKDIETNNELYYFIRVKTRFYLKPNHLPTVQIKHSPLYPPRQWLATSDYIDEDGNAWSYLNNDWENEGGIFEMIPELTLTKTDWELMKDHYYLKDTEILDGCWFYTEIGIFDDYINKYAEIKMNSKGAKRQIAKLFLNNLYGKFATSTDASFKVPYIKDDIVHFYDEESISLKKAGYIPIGSAITSYSRNFTIRAAQANYENFIYSDTDSIHLTCTPDEVKGAPEHPTKFNHWKYEACWDEAIFVRAKTYIEHVNFEDREEVTPYYNVRCAGMPDRAKANFVSKLTKEPMKETDDPEAYGEAVGVKHPNDDEKFFFKLPKFTLKDFKIGLQVPGSLKPKRIIGGIVLLNGTYVMRPSIW